MFKTEFKTIDDYLVLQTDQARVTLESLRQTIRKAAPEAVEVISYQMPAFKFHGMLVYFAAFKNHCSLFVSPAVILACKDRLTNYKLSKGTIQFPIDQPLPENLVQQIVAQVIQRNLVRETLKVVSKEKGIKP
jgi:uncharacterized protein YdhG (YjbR/CyaY superfamily)